MGPICTHYPLAAKGDIAAGDFVKGDVAMETNYTQYLSGQALEIAVAPPPVSNYTKRVGAFADSPEVKRVGAFSDFPAGALDLGDHSAEFSHRRSSALPVHRCGIFYPLYMYIYPSRLSDHLPVYELN